MNSQHTHRVVFWISFIVMFIQTQGEAFASHAQSADITYQCLGGNQYQISLSFYRDCAGVAAPTTATIDISSASCGQNLTLTLNQIPGTGIEVSPICTQMNTQCSGGTYPGVQEFKYTGIITLPMQCADWTFSFSLCCRNAAINTIVNPSAENIYVEALLNNLNFPCNSSPDFSNPPIPFVCVGQPYCFNNGSSDQDGDSLYYSLVTPRTGPATSVTYNSPYSSAQPLLSSPAVSFDNVTGDMCMWPSQLEVTVFAILVEEWRNGALVGSVMRDIQMRTINCTNSNPYVNGINNTGTYSITACAGQALNFTLSSFDIDSTQNVTINWNNAIAGATFISNGGSRPQGTFSWTPSTADIGQSHCFTVTVRDDNCPFNGSQTYSVCINVSGITLLTSVTDANCGASNGTASVQVMSGDGPFSYQWSGGGNSADDNGLSAGTYTVIVTGAGGCASSASATVGSGAAPGNLVMISENVSCYGFNNGTVTANVNGGQQPYSYSWSNGDTTETITGLSPGMYYVTISTATGCQAADTITITQPLEPLSYTTTQINNLCNGSAQGSATVIVTGGTAPYSFLWNTTPSQNNATASNLPAGSFSVIINDDNGCSAAVNFTITEPAALIANAMVINNVSCNGSSDGYATVGASGGTGFFSYSWNTNPAQGTQSVSGLTPGNYVVTVTDANSCSVTSSVSITEPAPLSMSAAAFPISCHGACDGQTVVIPTGGTQGYTYQWLPNGGTSASATGLCPGTYSVTVTDNNGCTATNTLAVTQPAPITLSTSGNATICLGQNTNLVAGATGGSGNYTFNWQDLGTGSTQTVSPAFPSTYSVTATDANGCVSPVSTIAINVTSLTAANLVVSGSAAICAGNTTDVSAVVSGNTGPVTITWSNGVGNGSGPYTVSPAVNTTYTVTVTDACSNVITATVPVVVYQLPLLSISPQVLEGCEEVTAIFTENSGQPAGSHYYWDFGDNYASVLASPSHTYIYTGNYAIELTVTSQFGCVNTASTTYSVTVHKPSWARFSSEGMDGSTLSPVYQFTNQSQNAAAYSWDFGDGSSSAVTDPQHTYSGKGIYRVMLITASSAGCLDTMIRDVEVKPVFTLYIPNAFTPDGNNMNDNFTAKGDEITDFNMMIFNRWGDMIFQTDDIQSGWDGRANNGSDVAQDGVYVYKIVVKDFEERHHAYTGHVTLLSQK